MKSNKLISVIIIIIIVAVVAGGGYYAYHYETTGTLKVSAADTPTGLSGVMDVNVTFSSIALHSAKASSNSTGWTNYSLNDKTVNIMNLTASNAAFLSNLSVHAGSYNMMKVYLKNVSVYVKAGFFGLTSSTSMTLNLTNSFALVVFVTPMVVSAHSTTSMVTDFNLSNNIHMTSREFTMSASVIIN
jgi:flagellar basal body-associated protein FliL